MDDFAQQDFKSDAEVVDLYKKRRKMSARGIPTHR